VSAPTVSQDKGVDLAVWIDEIERSLGNPLLVQVKTGNLSAKILRNQASRLREYMAKTHARCALLVYWDRDNREFAETSGGWPLVFLLSGPKFSRLLSEGRFVTELIRLRNTVVHRQGA